MTLFTNPPSFICTEKNLVEVLHYLVLLRHYTGGQLQRSSEVCRFTFLPDDEVQLYSLPKGALCSFDASQLLPKKRQPRSSIKPPIAKDGAQHFVNWNERLICINDWYLFVFIHEKDLLSISNVLFFVHLRLINALKCHAEITQKYGVTSCSVFSAITCWIRFCHEWAFSQSLKTPQTSVNRGNITVPCVGMRELSYRMFQSLQS